MLSRALFLALFLLPSTAASQGFVERASELGLEHETVTGLDMFESGVGDPHQFTLDWLQTGIALADVDGDGDLDLIGCGGVSVNTVLLRNESGQYLRDETASQAITTRAIDRMPALADYDRDGDLDLYVAAAEGKGIGPIPGHNRLYRNDGLDGGSVDFVDVTAVASTYGSGRTVYAQWSDLDMDGLPDLYLGEFFLTPNLWYRNNGDTSFTELGAEHGLDDAGNCHVAAMMDTDRDGYPDVIVANDHKITSAMFYPDEINPGDAYLHNQGDGTFATITNSVAMGHLKGHMGLSFGDANYDGWMDVYKTDVQANKLVINHGAPVEQIPWSNEQAFYGVANATVPFPGQPGVDGASVGWGAFFMNADLDRWLDLYVVNGHVAASNPHINNMPHEQPNAMFMGLGPDEQFVYEDRAQELGLYDDYDDRGGAIADLDEDGDLDIVVTEDAGSLRYYENRLPRNGQGWIIVEAQNGTSTPEGVGTVVTYTDSDGHDHQRVIGVDAPTASQSERIAHFGIGLEPDVDLTVEFPSGMVRSYPGVPANTRLVVTEPEMIQLSTRTLPMFSSGLDPTSVLVTAYAFAQDGTPLDGTAVVDIAVGSLSPLTPVQHVAGNEFQRYFRSADVIGPSRVNVTFDGWEPRIRPLVHIFGPPHEGGTTMDVSPEAIRAASADRFSVTAVPKDVNGLLSGPGLDINLFAVPALTALGPVVDEGDGRYTREFAAPPGSALGRFFATSSGDGIGSAPFEVGAGISGAMSELDVQETLPPQAASPHQIKVVVTPRDAQGRRLGPNAKLKLKVHVAPPLQVPGASGGGASGGGAFGGPQGAPGEPAPGAKSKYAFDSPLTQVVVNPAFGKRGREDGTFVFVIEKPEDSPLSELPKGTVEVWSAGEFVLSGPFDYRPAL